MDASRPILRVGLTGGIASGKTTVAEILAELGAFVLDADDLARDVTKPGTAAHARILERFGEEFADERGAIDRPRLAALVFHDAVARKDLNAIVHPEVRAEAQHRIVRYTPDGRAPIAVFDAALLVETGGYRDFHRLIVVSCRRATQLRRLLARDGMTAEEAEARLDAQAPLEEKLLVADYVVDTEGTLRETRAKTERIYALLLGDFEREFGRAD